MGSARVSFLALLSLGVGCDNPEPAEFADQYPAALCDWVESCAAEELTGGEGIPAPLEDVADCEGEAATAVEACEQDSNCSYDAGQARQCLEALEGSCEGRTAIYYECKRVYRGDECPRITSVQ